MHRLHNSTAHALHTHISDRLLVPLPHPLDALGGGLLHLGGQLVVAARQVLKGPRLRLEAGGGGVGDGEATAVVVVVVVTRD